MNHEARTVLIVAGETSGDTHAALLVDSLKKKGNFRFVGIGGDRMKAAGVELIHHVNEMSVMGFYEVISKLPFFRRVRRDLLRVIRDQKPSAVVLVDYPGFNLRFADSARRNGLKVVYFISPQIWAWGRGRLKKIRRAVDLMITIFKFEEKMYQSEGVNAHFVGHPLVDKLCAPKENEIREFRDSFLAINAAATKDSQNKGQGRLLALLPGSRLQEVNRILPMMLRSLSILRQGLAEQSHYLRAVIGCAPGIDRVVYRKIVDSSGAEVYLTDRVDMLMSSADAGIVASGTATLESALHNLPMVVVYRTSLFTFLIGKLVVKLDSISLVNIVGQKKIVEELVQSDFKPMRTASIVKELLVDSQVTDEIRKKYAELKEILGPGGATDRAAELIMGIF
jgi:lipid-A-disaccharide synthase